MPQIRQHFGATSEPYIASCCTFRKGYLALVGEDADRSLANRRQLTESALPPGSPERLSHLEPPAGAGAPRSNVCAMRKPS